MAAVLATGVATGVATRVTTRVVTSGVAGDQGVATEEWRLGCGVQGGACGRGHGAMRL